MDSVELLRTLSNAFGPSGFEDDVRDILSEMVEPLVDDVRTDVLGNLIATKRGRGERTLMLDAHMDEIGFMISHVEDGGFLRFTQTSGWDQRIVPANALTIQTTDGGTVKGMIGTAPPHITPPAEREKVFKLDDLFVDIGATSAAEVAEMGVRAGSPAVIAYPFERIRDGVIMGKALDDRAGCAIIVKTLEALQGTETDATVVAAFTVQEEVGLRGAGTAAFQIEPDIALALETTIAADTPGISGAKQITRQGKGPVISVMDAGFIVPRRVVDALTSTADAEGIPWQYKTPPAGGTDAGAIHRSRGGVLAGVVSLPGRYIHSPYSLLRLSDFEYAVALVTAFTRRCPGVVGL
ncbi:MAG TPA: M42 family metallopeptidase [Thermomicrobiales bacterium]|nr:M42 family metallopeptidase [Thermomicrobiales bacterium]